MKVKINKEQIIYFFNYLSNLEKFAKPDMQKWLWYKYDLILNQIKSPEIYLSDFSQMIKEHYEINNENFLKLNSTLNAKEQLNLYLISELNFFHQYIEKKSSYVFDLIGSLSILSPIIISSFVFLLISPIWFLISLFFTFVLFAYINKFFLKFFNKIFLFLEKVSAQQYVDKINKNQVTGSSLKELKDFIENKEKEIKSENIQPIVKKSIFIIKYLEKNKNNKIEGQLNKLWTQSLDIFFEEKNEQLLKSNLKILEKVLDTFIEEIYFLKEEMATKEKIYWISQKTK